MVRKRILIVLWLEKSITSHLTEDLFPCAIKSVHSLFQEP